MFFLAHTEALTPQYDVVRDEAFERWLGFTSAYGGGVVMMDLEPCERRKGDYSCLSTWLPQKMHHEEKITTWKPRKEPPPAPDHTITMVSDPQASEWERKILLFQLPNLWNFVAQVKSNKIIREK